MTNLIKGTEHDWPLPDDAGLEPCPFCGSKDIDPEGWASTDKKGPACDGCGALAETVEIWNTRYLQAVKPDIEKVAPCKKCGQYPALVNWQSNIGPSKSMVMPMCECADFEPAIKKWNAIQGKS